MKRGLLLLMFILLLSPALSQNTTEELEENRLLVRFHSIGGEAEVDLIKFLGVSENYYTTHSSNVTVEIDSEFGKAKIRANPGWSGAETISFTTIKPTPLIRLPEIEEIIEISPEDLEALFSDFANNTFIKVIDLVGTQEIERIVTSITEDQIIILVNDEAELRLGKEGNKPAVAIDLLIPNQNPPDVFEISPRPFKILGIALTFLLFVYIFRIPIRRLLFIEIEKDSLKTFLVKKLIKIESYEGIKQEKALKETLRLFFSKFSLNQKSTPLQLNKSLERNGVQGYIKQEIISLFDDYSNFRNKDKTKIILKLRDLIKSL